MAIQPFAEQHESITTGLDDTEAAITATPAAIAAIANASKADLAAARAFALRFDLAAAAVSGFTRFDLERVLGTNDLVGVDYLARGLAAAGPVARLIFPGGKGYATGFLIAPRLLLTNRHVFGTPEEARGALAEFGYELTMDGGAGRAEVFRLDPDSFFVAGPYDPAVPRAEDVLDFCVVAVAPRSDAGTDLARWGYHRLDDRPGKIVESEYVTIIQHPSGAHKQVALRENKLVRKEEDRPVLAYESDTAPGSSGAPCFNDQWQVVALHSRGVPDRDAEGRIKLRTGEFVSRAQLSRIPGLRDTDIAWKENLGVRVSRIVRQLKEEQEASRKAGAAVNPLLAALLEDIARGGPPVVVPQRAFAVEPAFDAPVERAARSPRPRSHPTAREPDGYTVAFLPGHRIALPELTSAALRFGKPATNRRSGGTELSYTHFSVVQCAERRLAFFTAVNIDGRKSVPIDRGRDSWAYDDRILRDEQAGDWLYRETGGNFFDRGHLVRRLDPCWGSPERLSRNTFDMSR